MKIVKLSIPKLSVGVYKFPLGDCTLNGISGRFDHLDLVDKPEPYPETERPRIVIVERNLFSGPYLTAYPVDNDGNVRTEGMAGGNFVYCSDSRFPARYPVSVHDRFEQFTNY